MKKLISLIPFFILSAYAGEQITLPNQTINNIRTAHLVIKKSEFKDHSGFIALISDYNVSRFMFGAEATQEEINELAKSQFKTKFLAPLMFALPTRLVGHRWMIRKSNPETEQLELIGSLAILKIEKKEIKDLIRQHDPENYKNYLNIGILLKSLEWGKGYARESIFALISELFAAKEFKHITGLVISVNHNHERCLKAIMKNENEAKAPFVYRGEVTLPKGFTKYMPKACTTKNFTLTKEDFLQFVGLNRKNNNN